MSDEARVPRGQAAAVSRASRSWRELDIAERRLPQDGRIGFDLERRQSTSASPDAAGDGRVGGAADPRLQPGHALARRAGDEPEDRSASRRRCAARTAASSPPARRAPARRRRSTRSSTLVRTPEKTPMTIEDPVEYRFDGVNQIQVSERDRADLRRRPARDLRADPDVIMVGEMRDRETRAHRRSTPR